MQGSSSPLFRQVFLKKWLLGLKLGGVHSSKTMSLLERKRAIKLSADVAMASAGFGSNWSRALVADLAKQEENKALVKSILGEDYERLSKPWHSRVIPRSKKIVRRCFRTCSRIRKSKKPKACGLATKILAKKLVEKKTKFLKGLIPGGESLDALSLLDETLDYVVSLRAQVELMQHLTNVVGASNRTSLSARSMQGEKDEKKREERSV